MALRAAGPGTALSLRLSMVAHPSHACAEGEENARRSQGRTALSTNGRAAVAYAERLRWPVLPLAPRQKVPLLGSNGVHDATLNVAQIHRWWETSPDANIGISCGAKSGFWVLDIDPRNGGEYSLNDLIADQGALPDTVIQETGGGGLHYLFHWPSDGRLPRRSPRAGIDVKGEGGYILAAPSVHPNGKEYCWQELSRPLQIPVCPGPEWLLDLVCERKGSRSKGRPVVEWEHLLGPVEQGQRHERLLSVAGYLFRRLPAVIAFQLASAWAEARLKPRLDADDVESLIGRVARRENSRIGGRR